MITLHFIYFGTHISTWGSNVLPQKGNQFVLDYRDQRCTFCVDTVRFVNPDLVELHVSQIVHLV